MSNLNMEQVRLLVQEEGKSARNILAFSVPCDGRTATADTGGKTSTKKPPVNPKSQLIRLEQKVPKLVTILKGSHSRIRSASAGRDRKSDLQARYWGLLFENLRRAVDEIYQTCESDESVEECKESIMILESYTKDFRNLIEWLRLKWNYEKTPAPQRPTSLAWEVRKSSPAKPSCATLMGQLQKTPGGFARRILNFEEESVVTPHLNTVIVETKALVTAEYPIQTICEAAETGSTNTTTVQVTPLPATSRKLTTKTGPETNKSSRSGEVTISRSTTLSKPKSPPMIKAGKASKNAVNTEVQSLSLAQKVQPQPGSQAQRTQPPSALQRSLPISASPRIQSSQQAQSWAQRIQSVPVTQQSPRTKPTKPDLPKSVARQVVVRQPVVPVQSVAVSKEQNDGWETVRGRTRSRASPSKAATPALTRASTMVYGSRLEAKQAAKAISRPQQNRPGLRNKPSAAQSLPSLCDCIPQPKEITKEQPQKLSNDVTVTTLSVQDQAPEVTAEELEQPARDDSAIATSDEDKDEAEEAAEVAEEEAEMARREEALTMEEENIQREMRETERSDNEGDETWDDPINVTPASTPEAILTDDLERLPMEREALEEKYHVLLENCSWADQMELLDQLEEMAAMDGARQPGRALQVHEKLSSPSRRRMAEPCEAFQQHEAKQLRAQQHRAAFREERLRKRRELTKRMDEVRAAKAVLLEEKRLLLERKMKRAEEKRQKHLAEIVKKAHDEESKKREIAFINTIEAQNKQHDFIVRIQTQEERIQGLQEERQRRQEERNKAKEALEVRKRALEAERQAKMAFLQEKRRQREERIDREHQEKEKERLELAREKQRDREERLSALQAAHQASQTELQRKIQQKQEESARRHEENIEQIRQKALELSILRFSSAGGADDAPRLVHYETARMCSLCNVQIHSEVILMSHLRGRKHMEALKNHYGGKEPSREQSESSNLKFIVDVNYPGTSDEATVDGADGDKGSAVTTPAAESEKDKRAKALKKRAKKLRSKVMQLNAPESSLVTPDGANRHRITRLIHDLERDSSAYDRHWGELVRLLEKGSTTEQLIFGSQRGVSVVGAMLSSYYSEQEHGRSTSPLRAILAAVQSLRLAARSNLAMAAFMMNSKTTPLLLNLLAQRLETLEGNGNGIQASGQLCVSVQPMSDALATAILNTWVAIIDPIVSDVEAVKSNAELPGRLTSLVSYAVSLGLVDRLAFHVGGVGGPLLDEQSSSTDLLLASLKFLTSLVDVLHFCKKAQSKKAKPNAVSTDTTQLVEAFQMTELAGVINALYGLLLHQGAPSTSAGRPAELADNTTRFTVASLQLIHRLALLDLTTFQAILGAEGVSLEFRHIASFLLWYGVNARPPVSHLLNLTIVCIGFFATGHHDNQMILQSGHMPSVLQQLCRLPFGYFSDKALQAILLPTLLACCHDNPANRAVLQKEMSYQMVEDYVNSDEGRAVHLVRTVLHASPNTRSPSVDNS